MPIARTFSEELLLEWLTLSNYLVELGIPVPKVGRRGRNEVDAVGVRKNDDRLEILHAEVGAWTDASDVQAKFAKHIMTKVESHVREILKWKGPIEYVKLYIAIYLPKSYDQSLTPGIKVWDFQRRFVRQEVPRAVNKWRRNNLRSSGDGPELPESMWLLKTLDFR